LEYDRQAGREGPRPGDRRAALVLCGHV